MNKSYTVNFEQLESWKELNSNDLELAKKAFEASEQAYAPYSEFKVGASVKLDTGEIISGSNQENIAYPSGLCAERVALFYAGSNFPNSKIDTICVVAKGDLIPVDKILSPCGGCRQVMIESEGRQASLMRVVLISQNGVTLVFQSSKDLLPLAFGFSPS